MLEEIQFFRKKKTAPTCVGNSSFYKKNESAYDGYLGDTFLQVITIFELFMSERLFYKLSFILVETYPYLWSLSDCKQPSLWPLLRKTVIPICSFLDNHSYLESNSAISFQNAFLQVFTALNLIFFKIIAFLPNACIDYC